MLSIIYVVLTVTTFSVPKAVKPLYGDDVLPYGSSTGTQLFDQSRQIVFHNLKAANRFSTTSTTWRQPHTDALGLMARSCGKRVGAGRRRERPRGIEQEGRREGEKRERRGGEGEGNH